MTADQLTLLVADLRTLAGQMDQTADLLERGPRRGWPSPVSEEEQARRWRQWTREAHDRVENDRNRIPTPGPKPAPVSLSILDARILAAAMLLQEQARLAKHLNVCLLPVDAGERVRSLTIPEPQRARMLADQVETHADHLAPLLIAVMGREVSAASRALAHAIDEEPKHHLHAPCPYCNRRSLWVYEDRQLVLCVGDSNNPAEACYCPIEDCPCHAEEYPRRHSWRRDQWGTLAGMLERNAQ